MNIAKIVRITPDGAAFTTANGTFYPFQVGFDNHHAGQANSKSNPPPWKVGEIVGYEVSGQSPRGQDKFKIKRNPDANDGIYSPPQGTDEDMPGDPKPAHTPPAPRQAPSARIAPPARQSGQNAHNGPSSLPVNLPHGATVGASINKAVGIWISTNTEGHAWTESSATLVEKWARQLLEIHTAMERGEPPVNTPF